MLAGGLLRLSVRTGGLCRLRPSPLAEASTNHRRELGSTGGGDNSIEQRVYTVPNALCALRIAASPCIVGCLLTHNYLPAAALTAAAGITDGLDGWIARRWPSQRSAIGSVIDPLADKVLVTSLSLSLAWVSLLPMPLAALYVSRDLMLIGGAAANQWRAAGASDNWLSGVQEVKPLTISKCNTTLQVTLLTASLAAPLLGLTAAEVPYQLLWWMSGFTTVLSGIGYSVMPRLLQHRQQLEEAKKKAEEAGSES